MPALATHDVKGPLGEGPDPCSIIEVLINENL